MNTILKKILIISIIVLIVALIGLLVYNLLSDQEEGTEPEDQVGQFPETEQDEGTDQQNGEQVTPSPEQKIKAISTEKVLSPTLTNEQTKVIYFSQYNGNIWQSSFDGSNLTRVASTNMSSLINSIWSPDKNQAIYVFKSTDENIGRSIYNFNQEKSYSLDGNIKEIDWSPDGNQICYQYLNENTNENNISIANSTGGDWTNVLNLRIKDINIDWTNAGISFYQKPSGIAKSSLFLLNPINRSLTKILSDIYGLSIKWSPQGDKVLFSQTNDKGENLGLYVANKDGTNKVSTGISTLVEKCVWSKDNRSIFCAIPKKINSTFVLPDDFYKGKFSSNDEFWKINLETNEKTKLLNEWEDAEILFDAIKLFLAPLEDYIFFVNKKDGLLYSIEL